MEAALKGAKQIGFTVISLSFSLIAVFIPLLFMTGIVGRLVPGIRHHPQRGRVVSAIVSLTLTPMMCAGFLEADDQRKHGQAFTNVSEERFRRDAQCLRTRV